MKELKVASCFEFEKVLRGRSNKLFYSKSEVDAVLDEKDKEIAELKEQYKTEVKQLLYLIRDKENNFNSAFDSEEKEIRHQKYKRCLAMARMCEERCARYDLLEEKSGFSWRREIDFYFRWCQRWLELAKKFKPNSTDK